jgi:autotransporter-associated beta strand protein
MKPRIPTLVLGSLALLLATSASAQTTYHWTSSSDDSWGDAANWTDNGIPGDNAGDNAVFNTASSVSTITLDGSRVLNSVSFGSANPSWTINPGDPTSSALTVGTGTGKFTVTDTIVNFNAALNAGAASANLVLSGDGGTVNFTGALGSYTHLGSSATVGTTGMIYNLNFADIVKSRLYVGFNNLVTEVPVNGTAGTTVNVNASQTSSSDAITAGGTNTSTAGVLVIRNGATWTQNGGSIAIGYSNSSGTVGRSHGRVDVGVVGDSSGNLTIGGGGALTVGNRAGTGILNINNGTVTANVYSSNDTGLITLASSAGTNGVNGATGTLNLNAGGTLITARNFVTSGSGSGAFNFDGGLLRINRATGNVTTDLFGTGITVNVLNGGARIDTQAHSTVINRDIVGTGNGGLEKLGVGTLTLNGANTFTGTTKVTGGTLALGSAGSIANSSTIIVGTSATLDVSAVTGGFSLGASQTLAGPGTVTGAMAVHGTLSPGNSPGTLSTGSQTWFNGGDFNMQVHDATGIAGTGFDTIAIDGALDLTNLSNLGFAINLWSLSATGPDVSGNALNFDNALAQSWTILTTSGGITGFDAGDFAINTSANNGTTGFSNSLAGGSFALVQSGNNLQLNFAPVPEPRAALLGSLGMIALLRRRR